jgi:hypothetical protein
MKTASLCKKKTYEMRRRSEKGEKIGEKVS